MNSNENMVIPQRMFDPCRFYVRSLQDEIEVDDLCHRLLKFFRQDMTSRLGLSEAEAGSRAHGADYFLRDFIISERRKNIFEVTPRDIAQFAGNWYIVKNLEPNIAELEKILRGVEGFYEFSYFLGIIGQEGLPDLAAACARLDYYGQRIEEFWAIEGSGYFAWEAGCSLKN